jgi:membrane-associated phospholipid phosphatase
VLVNQRRVLAIALIALVVSVGLGVLVAVPATLSRVQMVDDWVYGVTQHLQVPPMVWVARVLAFTGSAVVNWPLRAALVLLLAWRRRWLQLSAFVLAVITSEVMLGAMKSAYARPRPPDPQITTTGYAFPSGHAVAAVVTAVGVVLALLPPGPSRTRWELRAILFVLAMALSRVYLNAHWISDVAEGIAVGTALALLFPSLLQSARMCPRDAAAPPGPPAPVADTGSD